MKAYRVVRGLPLALSTYVTLSARTAWLLCVNVQ